MSITFYYAPATSATRVHWALEELGISYQKVRLDLAKGEQKSPEFLELNPNGKVPALVDDGTPMFESLAIIIHLGEKYGVAKSLWPAPGSAQSAEALMWAVWGTVTVTARSTTPPGRGRRRGTCARSPARSARRLPRHRTDASLVRPQRRGRSSPRPWSGPAAPRPRRRAAARRAAPSATRPGASRSRPPPTPAG